MQLIQKKVCVLGDFAVGKTSLVRRYIEGRFDDKYLSTIGVKISRKSIDRGTHRLNLLLWDMAGKESLRTYETNYLRGAAAALVVCDLTRQETLDSLSLYSQQFHTINPDSTMVFLGNKYDLADERQITTEDLEKTCHSLGGPYLLTSAKTGEQVEAAFQTLADMLDPAT